MSGDAIVNAETLRLKANRSVIKSQGKAAKALSAVIAKMSDMPDIGERMSILAEALDSFCAVCKSNDNRRRSSIACPSHMLHGCALSVSFSVYRHDPRHPSIRTRWLQMTSYELRP